MKKSIIRRRGGRARWALVSGAVVILSMGVVALAAGNGGGWGHGHGHGWGPHPFNPPPVVVYPPPVIVPPVIVPPVVVPPPNITNISRENTANVNTLVNVQNNAMFDFSNFTFGTGPLPPCSTCNPWQIPAGFDFDFSQSAPVTVGVTITQN